MEFGSRRICHDTESTVVIATTDAMVLRLDCGTGGYADGESSTFRKSPHLNGIQNSKRRQPSLSVPLALTLLSACPPTYQTALNPLQYTNFPVVL